VAVELPGLAEVEAHGEVAVALVVLADLAAVALAAAAVPEVGRVFVSRYYNRPN
jgi:hypothetical protein